jgi:hypothetical protein
MNISKRNSSEYEDSLEEFQEKRFVSNLPKEKQKELLFPKYTK